MEDFKPNSNRYKQEMAKTPEKREKVEKVVTGIAKTKKRNGMKKFAGSIVSSDVDTVTQYLLTEVLIPAAKRTISDIVTNGIDMLLYNEAGRSHRRNGGGSKFNYSGCFDRPSEPRRAGSANRTGFDYDEIIFDSRGDAELVLEGMEMMIEKYGRISVADLYDMADVSNTNFAAHKYGWADIRNARVAHVRDGYILNLPHPMPID